MNRGAVGCGCEHGRYACKIDGGGAALKSTCEKSESKFAGSEIFCNCSNSFGIPEAAVTSSLCSCTLKSV